MTTSSRSGVSRTSSTAPPPLTSQPDAQRDDHATVGWRVGDALNSKWTIDALLGAGGMGTVYAATHRNGSRAALKLLHAEFATDPGLKERFLREGKIANRVDHPARVAVTDDDVSDRGEPFLVMELLAGKTLGTILYEHGGKLSVDDTLRVFDVVLDLLARCHDVGVVHRDIKPANIFVTNRAEVKVLDFGVARMRESGTDATRAGTALGTPSFMAPEQALGQDSVDGRADIFSVGACLFLALSGTKLHHGKNETESYVMAATRAAPSIANVAPTLPVEVVALVDRALAYDRNRRFPDARAMRAELLALASASRAGALEAPAAPKAAAIVTRGEQRVEGEDEPLDKLSIDKARDRIAGTWRLLGVVINNVRQFGWTNTTTTRALEIAYADVVDALASSPAGVRWDVSAHAFAFEGQPVWTPDRAPMDRIPWQLFADGIRQVQLKQGLSEEELRDFIAILMREQNAGQEDDAVTALWDRRFEHVGYFAIDSFTEGDADEREGFERARDDVASKAASLAMVDRDWDNVSLEARAMQANLTSMMKEAGEAAASLALDPMTRASLGAQATIAQEVWNERYADAFVEAYREGVHGDDLTLLTDAVRDWSRDQLSLRSYTSAFRMLDTLGAAFNRVADGKTAAALERKLRVIMFPPSSLKLVLTDLARDGAPEVDAGVASGVGRALDALKDDSIYGLVCECFGTSRDDRLRAELFRYVKRFSVGHERDLGALTPASAARVAIPVVRLLGELKTKESSAALEGAFRNPSSEVRVEALMRVHDAPPERIREEIHRLLAEGTTETRCEALRLIARASLVTAGPVLGLKIQETAFGGLPLAERKLCFETLAALNPRRAEALCLELLSEKKIMPTKQIEESRAIAAELLSRSNDAAVLKALQKTAADRWFASQAVRDAATRAVREIAARNGKPGAVKETKETKEAPKKVEEKG